MLAGFINMAIVYGINALLALLILIAYLLWEKKQEKHFVNLFISVVISNLGYFLESISGTLMVAMLGNKLAYLGSSYSMLIMVLIVMDVCQIRRKKWQSHLLFAISTFALLVAVSGTLFGLYYKSVSLEIVNGMTHLVKEYGPLHILYSAYLAVYFSIMAGIIFYAYKYKTLASPKYTVFLMTAVFLNLGVWAIEHSIQIQFEFLSTSYIISEVMLLLIHGTLRDYGIIQPGGSLVSVQMLTKLNTRQTTELPPEMEELFNTFTKKVQTLSSAEQRILNYYIEGRDPADIPDLAFISIHTVKKHNRSIYQKLEVASRDEMMLYIELFRCCGRIKELTGGQAETE